MKQDTPFAIAIVFLGLAASPFAHAEESAKKPAAKPAAKAPVTPREQVFAKYDLDHNKNLDVSESESLVRAYERNPDDPMIKPFDTDHDGKISDQELMKLVYPNGQSKPPPKAKGKPKGKPPGKKKGKK